MTTNKYRQDSPDECYFDGASRACDSLGRDIASLEEQIECIRSQQSAVVRLDDLVREIDCNIGAGTLETDDGTVAVTASVPNPSDDAVRELLHEFDWVKKFDVGYNTRSKLVTFSLETSLETLADSDF